MNEISFDFNNMTARCIGACHGIMEDEIEELMPKIDSALGIVSEGRWGFMRLPYAMDTVSAVKRVLRELGDIETLVVIGIGGSSLGARALDRSLRHPFKNNPRIFVLENVDVNTIKGIMNVVDMKKAVFNVVTKSGGTAETMANFMVLKNMGVDKGNIVVTTDPEKGDLRKIADDIGYKRLDIPHDVGGRYSVFSAVGLFPACAGGIDIDGLLAGAAEMDKLCRNKDIWSNPACLSSVLHYIHYKKGRHISVFMPYSDRLKGIAEWFCQLLAESIGKKKDVGFTPVRTLGVIDQHSQLQLYMDGPEDKVITFVKVDDPGDDIVIPHDFKGYPSAEYLGGHTINELMLAEQNATETALSSRGRPSCTIMLKKVSARTIGALMYMLEVQTAFTGELFGINAFDQPGVEEGKKITGALLGRPGYGEKKKEIESLPPKDSRYIIN